MMKIGKEYFDDLTGLFNRRYLNKYTKKHVAITQYHSPPLSILVIDIDHFKNINDTYGHARGDIVLKEFAKFLKHTLRQNDTVFRYGGDEFICFLPNSDYNQSLKIAERLIEYCRKKEFSQIRITISLGIASFPDCSNNWKDLFEFADKNLYSAKRHGRNQIGYFIEDKKRLIIPTKEIIGRDKELKSIAKFIKKLHSGIGKTLCISGEAGVGKTRLIQEIMKDSNYQNIQFLRTNLSATTKSIPYYPIREILHDIIRSTDEKCFDQLPKAYRIELTKIIPELFGDSQAREHPFMTDKFRLFEGVKKFLKLRCYKSPLFICVDNIHWSDEPSLELLNYLVRALKDYSILFVFVYRIEEVEEGLFYNILQLMSRENIYDEIRIETLEIADTMRMLTLILDSPLSHEIIKYIFNKTGGNPFFIEELIKSMEENRELIWNRKEWVLDEKRDIVIPISLESVVERKLNLIDKEAKNILEYMAVIGREFNFSFLMDVSGINEGQLFDLIDEIVKMRLLSESEGEKYYFSEDIIRDIIYNQIIKSKLKHYHKTTGNKLEERNKDNIENFAEELSFHFHLSGDCKNTLKYSIIAGDKARNSYANKDAIRFYTWAINCLSENKFKDDGEMKMIDCLKKRAKVLSITGENDIVIEDLNRAIDISKRSNQKEMEADCYIQLSKTFQDKSQYNKTNKLVNKALKIYKKLGNLKGEALCYNCNANTHFYIGEYKSALDLNKQALEIREKINDKKGIIESLNNYGIVYQNLGENETALNFYKRVLSIVDETGDLRGKSRGLNNIGVVYYNQGDYLKALKFYNDSLKIIKEIGHIQVEAIILNNIGSIYHIMCNYKEAMEYYEKALYILSNMGHKQAMVTTFYNLGIINFDKGYFEDAMSYFKPCLALGEEIGDKKMEAACLASMGGLFMEDNNYTKAKKHIFKAYNIASEIKSKFLISYIILSIITYHLDKGELDKAELRLAENMKLVKELKSKEFEGEVLNLYGRYYTEKKQWEKALSYYKKAIALFKKLNNFSNNARTYYSLAHMYKKMGEDVKKRRYMNIARKMFKKCEANGWLEKIDKELV